MHEHRFQVVTIENDWVLKENKKEEISSVEIQKKTWWQQFIDPAQFKHPFGKSITEEFLERTELVDFVISACECGAVRKERAVNVKV